jgi:hypothetical protein
MGYCRDMRTSQFRECQTVRATNEFGEVFTGYIAVIQPCSFSDKHRLTIRKPDGNYFNAYTKDEGYWKIEVLKNAPDVARKEVYQAVPMRRESPALPSLPAGVFGYSWDQIESMQGQGKGMLCR